MHMSKPKGKTNLFMYVDVNWDYFHIFIYIYIINMHWFNCVARMSVMSVFGFLRQDSLAALSLFQVTRGSFRKVWVREGSTSPPNRHHRKSRRMTYHLLPFTGVYGLIPLHTKHASGQGKMLQCHHVDFRLGEDDRNQNLGPTFHKMCFFFDA